MDVRNCSRCGRLYQYIGGKPLCYACKEDDEKEFQKVKEYLYKHPNAAMVIVSEETGVSISTIRQYLREERLIISDDSPIGIECESCGASIKTGRFCKECAARLSTELKHSTGQGFSQKKKNATLHTERQKEKMHYFNQEKRSR